LTARERLANAGPPVVATLEAAKAARWNAATMLLPSPMQIRDAISAIPAGQSKTVLQVRKELAEQAGADVTCPRATTLGWLLVAEAAEEDPSDSTPWWRVTRERKPEARLPGGVSRHRELLLSEGVRI
jgi:alkylated DNA nucleotide flippase Atl1